MGLKRGKSDHHALINAKKKKKKTRANEEGENEGEAHAVTATPIQPSFPPTQQCHYSANKQTFSLPTAQLSTKTIPKSTKFTYVPQNLISIVIKKWGRNEKHLDTTCIDKLENSNNSTNLIKHIKEINI